MNNLPALPRRLVSPLTLRILAVHFLALLLLLAALFFQLRYQDYVLEMQSRNVLERAALLAELYGQQPEDFAHKLSSYLNLADNRLRVFDEQRQLIFDSHAGRRDNPLSRSRSLQPEYGPLEILLLAGMDSLARSWRLGNLPEFNDFSPRRGDALPLLLQAYDGVSTSGTFRLAADNLVFIAAAPIALPTGGVAVAYLTRNDADLRTVTMDMQLDLLRLMLAAIIATALLSVYLSGVLARPIQKLADAAQHLRYGRGRRMELPDFSHRHDEIGDLSLALRAMTADLWHRLDAIDHFAADVAHELKNPLTSLRSALETLDKVHDPERRLKLMNIMHHDIRRMDRLISDIAYSSRLDAELSRANTEPGNIIAVCQNIAAADAALADSSQARVVLQNDTGQQLLWTECPEGRLMQLLQNLISNARSFAPAHSEIKITLRLLDQQAQIQVDDDGSGIPPAKLEHIFDRFYSDRPVGEKYGAHSGLGLSICRQITEAYGGSITADNRYREDGAILGARFTIRLPLLKKALR